MGSGSLADPHRAQREGSSCVGNHPSSSFRYSPAPSKNPRSMTIGIPPLDEHDPFRRGRRYPVNSSTLVYALDPITTVPTNVRSSNRCEYHIKHRQPTSHSHPLGVDAWPSTITDRRPSDPYVTSHPEKRMFNPPDLHSTASVSISRSHQARVASSTSRQLKYPPPPIDPYAHPPQSHDRRSPVHMDRLPTPTSYE
ncbi:hypothetical protein ONZ45_g12282 [Pleurotus djamor]|nr:hypothetical protein ONZ45_g12282 [Pleurotus djamor]